MDPSINPVPPPDPTVSRVKRPVDAHRDSMPSETQGDSLGTGLGSTMLGGTDVVVIWSADAEVAEPEAHEPKFEFNPLEGLSRDAFGLTADQRLYARTFVETLATGLANTYKKAQRVSERLRM